MGFLMKDSKLIATYYLQHKGAILLALLRWVLSRAVKLSDRATSNLSALVSTERLRSLPPPPSPPSGIPSETAGDSLPLAIYGGAMAERLQVSCDTCTVCFSPLVEGDEVRVLRNCRHVYHRECLDRWVGCDPDRQDGRSNHRTCPLCRAPLWAPSLLGLKRAGTEPRWGMKRLCSAVWRCDP